MADGYDLGKAYIQIIPSAKGIKGSLENVIAPEAEKAGEKSGNFFTRSFKGVVKTAGAGVGKGLSTIANVSFKGAIAGATALASGMTAIGGASIKSYADTEQLVGGVKTLFGARELSIQEYAKSVGKSVNDVQTEYSNLLEAENTVLNNAQKAYETAGLSANQYMETVTGFSASLVSSLGGDTKKAAQLADQAIIDMSDNANKMGSNIVDIQNAYQGFAKQNYTMLDNLKLGYGGTKTEMERLLKEAQAISGIEYDIDSYADVVEAIHVIQDEMGITETTAEEAAKTISGSIGMLKSSFSNLVSGIASGNADFKVLIGNIERSFKAVMKNIGPAINRVLQNIPQLLKAIIPIILKSLTGLLNTLIDIFIQMVQMLQDLLPQIMPAVIQIISSIINAILGNITLFLRVGIEIMLAIIQGITEIIPKLTETLPSVINSIVNFFISNIDFILDASIQLMMALIDAIPVLIDALIPRLPEIIITILNAVIEATPKLFEAGVKLFFTLIKALGQILVELGTNLPKIWESIKGALWDLPGKLWNILKEAVSNFSKWISETLNVVAPGMQKVLSSIGQWLSQIPGKIWNWIVGSIAKVAEWGSKLASKGAAAAKSLLDAVKNGLASLPGAMFNVGVNLIKGFWNGINNVKNWLWSKISGFFDGILGGIKSFFGIKSPSRVFRDQIGKMLPAGMAVGIEDNLGVVDKAMDEMGTHVMGKEFETGIEVTARSQAQLKNLEQQLTITAQDKRFNAKPSYINLNINGHSFKGFVEDIGAVLDQNVELQLNY